MKGLLLGLVLLVLFVHFGGSNVPKVLKDNKQMVYGVTIGLVLCSFFGVNVEGLAEYTTISDKNIKKNCSIQTDGAGDRKRRLPVYLCSDLLRNGLPDVNEAICNSYYQIKTEGAHGTAMTGNCVYNNKKCNLEING